MTIPIEIINWYIRNGVLYGDIRDGGMYVFIHDNIIAYKPGYIKGSNYIYKIDEAKIDKYFSRKQTEFYECLVKIGLPKKC